MIKAEIEDDWELAGSFTKLDSEKDGVFSSKELCQCWDGGKQVKRVSAVRSRIRRHSW